MNDDGIPRVTRKVPRLSPMNLTIPCLIVFCCFLTGIVCAESPVYGNWTEITSNANFSLRYDFGAATFNDRLWVIGGHILEGYMWMCHSNSSYEKNDVWSSPDGYN